MAILNKIRSKSIFLIAIIALALFAFIFSEFITRSGSVGDKQNTVGTVNGTKIDRDAFDLKVEQQYRGSGSRLNTVNNVWEKEVEGAVLKEQYEALGIEVSTERLEELLKGALESNPTFQDADGFFSTDKMQEYIAVVKQNDASAYQNWINFENTLKETELRTIYDNLVKAGVGATLKDGEVAYKLDASTVDIQYVQVPYTTIADEDVTVTKEDITGYINAHKDEFETEATRSIRYVKFDEKATLEDENALMANMKRLITENVLPDGRKVDELGLSEISIDEIANFVAENSDQPYIERFVFKNQLSAVSRDSLSTKSAGDVFGPYKDGAMMKLDRVVAVRQMPDSVQSKHILVSYAGSAMRSPETRAKEEAEKLADSILTVVKRDGSKFAELAQTFSSENSTKDKGGELGYLNPNNFPNDYRDFVVENNKGTLDIVETELGFHVVQIEDKKNVQTAMKIATVARLIEPSSATIDAVYATTQNFEIDARAGDFETVATDSGYTSKPVNSMRPLDENLPGEGSQRPIVKWAFEDETNVGDVKRFQVNNGYIVAQVTKSTKAGVMSSEDASARVKPILLKEKKAEVIKGRITSTDLNEMSTNQSQGVKVAGALNMQTPTISGAGNEPLVVGAAFALKEGETSDLIVGERGVYRVKVTKVNQAADLGNYTSYAARQTQSARAAVSAKVVSALKEAAEIDDARSTFY